MNWDKQKVTTVLTLFVCVVWTISAVVRIFQPWPEAHVLDAAMAPIIGYWFLANANGKKKNGVPA